MKPSLRTPHGRMASVGARAVTPLCFEEDPVVVYDGPSKHAAYLGALNQLAGRLLEATEYQEHLEELLERSGHTHRLAEET